MSVAGTEFDSPRNCQAEGKRRTRIATAVDPYGSDRVLSASR